MSDLLGLPALRTRVERYFQFETLHLTRYREELKRVVRTLIDEGEIPRAREQEITGKGATVSAEIIKLALREGLIESPSPKGPLQPGFPAKILEFYSPNYLSIFRPTWRTGWDGDSRPVPSRSLRHRRILHNRA